MTLSALFRRARPSQAGFTLVEIMVGLAIGMLATLVIMQVFSVFETQKRATTGTADAQINGSVALYNISRELQVAGYPLMSATASPLDCTTLTIDGTADTTVPNRLTPVVITNGVAATGVSASDSITLRYGNSLMGGIPEIITANPTGNVVPVSNNFGCQQNDITLVVNGAACALSSASAVSGTTTIELVDATAAVANANLACLGTWNEITYRVNGGNLERQNLANSNNFEPNMAGIVNLQAQYGISAAVSSNQITQWVDASGGTWAAPTVDDRNRIKAVRIAIIARNPKIEATNVTAACSSTTAAAPTGLCAWAGSVASPAPTVDLSQGDANWRRYRYRVFETIIPLRNVIWSR